tara:strand:+ start:767 stop:1042 length:276 start_codon:yes stop_codon:yes gene_type:complete
MTGEEIEHKNQEIVNKFLKENFKTRRVRIDKTFKRAIPIEHGFTGKSTYYLHPTQKDFKLSLYQELHQIVKDVFGFSNTDIDLIIYRYINP